MSLTADKKYKKVEFIFKDTCGVLISREVRKYENDAAPALPSGFRTEQFPLMDYCEHMP
jgi:hypothetical protein